MTPDADDVRPNAAVSTSASVETWLDRLAEAEGAPGGGAACAVMLGISAALLGMVAGYTKDDPRAVEAAQRLVGLRASALRAAEADGVRSAELGAALATPAEEPARDRAVSEAAVEGADSSAEVGRIAVALVSELRLLADIGNPNVTADLAVAALALVAGAGGALVNLQDDLRLAGAHSAHDELTAARERLDASARAVQDAREAASTIARAMAERVERR